MSEMNQSSVQTLLSTSHNGVLDEYISQSSDAETLQLIIKKSYDTKFDLAQKAFKRLRKVSSFIP